MFHVCNKQLGNCSGTRVVCVLELRMLCHKCLGCTILWVLYIVRLLPYISYCRLKMWCYRGYDWARPKCDRVLLAQWWSSRTQCVADKNFSWSTPTSVAFALVTNSLPRVPRSISNFTPKVGEKDTQRAIRQAFNVWQTVTPLSFQVREHYKHLSFTLIQRSVCFLPLVWSHTMLLWLLLWCSSCIRKVINHNWWSKHKIKVGKKSWGSQ